MNFSAKPVIFTDIDGVFHDCDSEPFCWAPYLWNLIAPHVVDLVVHSNWRLHHSLEEIRDWFPKPMCQRIVAVTEGRDPYGSIQQYVERFNMERFIVLDDCPERFPFKWFEDGVVIRCDPASGVSSRFVLEKIRIFLNDQTSTNMARNE